MYAAESVVEGIFEGAPWFVARLMSDGPFESDSELLERARVVALAMPEKEQIALLEAHPRIGAPPASVSAMSFREQGYDRAVAHVGEAARPALQAELDALNAAYESRFGFRYVIFVNGRSRQEIARLMQAALSADRDAEKERGLKDVVAIAGDRLRRIREGGT